MFLDLPRPVVFAHRGASAHAPENTMSAFQKALEQGSSAVEFDVKLTADGEVVVLHDQTVDRTTDGHGNLLDFPLAALHELDAGGWFDAQFRGERIPTLDQVFEAFGSKLFLNIELTNYSTPDDALAERVVERVKRHDLQSNILFSSFNTLNLLRVERLLPEVPRGLLIPPLFRGRKARRADWRVGSYQAAHPYLTDITPGWIKRVKAHGVRVHVWTVNHQFIMRVLFNWGVDGIFTDNPALALHVLEGKP